MKLRQQSDIENAKVSYDTKAVVVKYDAPKLTPERIIATIDKTGFKADPTTVQLQVCCP